MEDASSRRHSSRRTAGSTTQSSAGSAAGVAGGANVKAKRSYMDEYPPGAKAVIKRSHGQTGVLVDFVKVEMASLLRYKTYFNLEAPPNATKRELLLVVMRHFSQHPRLRNAEVISAFLYANQRYKKNLGQLNIN